VIAGAAAVGGRLPPRASERCAAVGGTLEWAARPRKRRVLAANLARALGPGASPAAVRAAVRAELVNEARRSADFLWSVAHPARAAAATRIDGEERLRAALARGRGAILAGPHVGGWEVVVPFAARVPDLPLTALVEDDWLAWAVAGIRSRGGLDVVPVTETPLRARATLARGGVVVMLSDFLGPGMRTAEVTLLGERIRLPAGPAALARLTGAALFPFAALPIQTRGWRVWIGDAIAPPPRASGRAGEAAALQELADAWTPLLRRHPTQWAAVEELGWLGRAASSDERGRDPSERRGAEPEREAERDVRERR
jgi:KDO2-lipid IV(A) lauroyltransferase